MRNCVGLIGKKTKAGDTAGALLAARVFNGEKIERKAKRKKPVRTSPHNQMNEKELERSIILELQGMGYWVHKTGMPGAFDYNCQYNVSGIADLIIIGKPAGVLFMEIKQESVRKNKFGGLRLQQVKFREFCMNIGVKYVVVYSKREAIEAVL